MFRSLIASAVLGGAAALSLAGVALATPSPNGPGQPGAPQTTCGNQGATITPGGSMSAGGSPFNPTVQAGTVYAGNPRTASLANAQSSHAVSQYDIACFQNTSNPGHHLPTRHTP